LVEASRPSVQPIDFLNFFVHLTFIDGAMVWQDGIYRADCNRSRAGVKSGETARFEPQQLQLHGTTTGGSFG
jgi:hypothetical protein